jgi:aminoglycoside phosphotransferase (APT) family kinase protein
LIRASGSWTLAPVKTMTGAGPDGRAGIDADLVRRLLVAQHPQWADLPIAPVEVDGWDNRTYRLGDDLTVRLPTAEGYVPAVAKEDTWLPRLAPHLPLPVPEPVATGEPGEGYPFPWSVRRWLPGAPAQARLVDDLGRFATDLAAFLRALWAADASDGPAAGAHSFHRGADPAYYDGETRRCLELATGIDTAGAAEVLDRALGAPYAGKPCWFHGDVAVGNLLVDDGRLSGVIDFGTSGVGDPACDLVIAWTFLDAGAREVFREAVDRDGDTWARARGWALWKSLLGLTGADVTPDRRAREVAIIDAVLADAGL